MIEARKSLLIVDDAKPNIDVLLNLLADEYNVSVVLSGEDALEHTATHRPDLILLDIIMPGQSGHSVCQALKENEKTAEIPIIFITGKSDEHSIEKAFDVGGVDYVVKPFKPKELLARIRTHLKLTQLIHDLEYVSTHDKLTGIYNRGKFFELSEKIWNEGEHGIYAAMLDIDKFKNINDSYGHPVGDLIIQAVAHAIREILDEDTVYGRIGGEEFAILWHGVGNERVIRDLEEIRGYVEQLKWMTDDGSAVHCTISCGAATADDTISSLDQLLKAADDALYLAKGKGRNRSILRGQ